MVGIVVVLLTNFNSRVQLSYVLQLEVSHINKSIKITVLKYALFFAMH